MDPNSCKEETLALMESNLTPISIAIIVFAVTEIAALLSTTGLLCMAKSEKAEEQWL